MGQWVDVSGRQRNESLSAVWDMVQATYAKIGLNVDTPNDLYEYNHWKLYEDGGSPVAFVLNKTTPYGEKLGLLGSDGSRAGRTAVKEYVAQSFFEAGNYAEVSHRMEDLALAADVPIVCAAFASDVLKKNVVPADDGVHYRRAIKNVGEVTKVLIGIPDGFPVTSSRHPQCPIPEASHSRRKLSIDGSNDAVFSHAMSRINL